MGEEWEGKRGKGKGGIREEGKGDIWERMEG